MSSEDSIKKFTLALWARLYIWILAENWYCRQKFDIAVSRNLKQQEIELMSFISLNWQEISQFCQFIPF